MKLYKVLNLNGSPCHGGSGSWNLPHGKRTGKWMPEVQDIELCECGYHLCRKQDLVLWLGPAIYEAEYRGDILEGSDKVVVSEARLISRLDAWNDRTARLFAYDCAERVLKIVNDKRCDNTVRVARLFADGKATADELAAASAAARTAASAAARAAASAAARAAASAAARAAASAAAKATARNAASAAARAAASAAAKAAASAAAWDAASAAAKATARNAARDAETKWQTTRLFQYLNGEIQ